MALYRRGSARHLLVLVLGVFGCYLTYGVLQEKMFAVGLKPYPWYISLLQFAIYALLARLEMALTDTSSLPLRLYALLGFLNVATMAFANASLQYLNYPTHVVFKSCKLIPVMIGGVLIQRKSYGVWDYLASGLLCLGLVVFTLADISLQASYSPMGLILITTSLMADAAIGNVQEKSMHTHKTTNAEMIFYSYSIGALYLLVFTVLTGQFSAATHYFLSVPPEQSFGYVVMFASCGYVGVGLVLTLIDHFDALTAVTVTNLRKVFTMVLSFIAFPKPYSHSYLLGGVFIAAGVALQVYIKQHKDSLKLPTTVHPPKDGNHHASHQL